MRFGCLALGGKIRVAGVRVEYGGAMSHEVGRGRNGWLLYGTAAKRDVHDETDERHEVRRCEQVAQVPAASRQVEASNDDADDHQHEVDRVSTTSNAVRPDQREAAENAADDRQGDDLSAGHQASSSGPNRARLDMPSARQVDAARAIGAPGAGRFGGHDSTE